MSPTDERNPAHPGERRAVSGVHVLGNGVRVMLVDDDKTLLRAMTRYIRGAAPRWQVRAFSSAREALAELKPGAQDIVVSDMSMPEMPGHEFLRRAQECVPDVVRIALTAEGDIDSGIAMVGPAHQYLSKPVDPAGLVETLTRAAELRTLFREPRILSIVGETNELPILSSQHARLMRALSSGDIHRVCQLVEWDPSLTGRVMQLTSTAFFGRGVPPKTVQAAVMRLGLKTLRALVMQQAIIHVCQDAVRVVDIDLLHSHAVLTAHLAGKSCIAGVDPEEAVTAGLLHNVGQIVLAARAARAYHEIVKESRGEGTFLPELERRRFGVTGAEVGAYLLGIWGLAEPLVQAVRAQHDPGRAPDPGLAAALYLASRLALDAEMPVMAWPPGELHGSLDLNWVEEAGADEVVAHLRREAQNLCLSHRVA
ncbi:MAG: HDOD domain-containing protein [Myxococcota bacterium]